MSLRFYVTNQKMVEYTKQLDYELEISISGFTLVNYHVQCIEI